MQIQEINGQRILTSEDDKYLCNVNTKAIGTKVQLAKESDGSEWTEITEEEKLQLEAEWETEDFQEATESDYQNALAEMGVELNG